MKFKDFLSSNETRETTNEAVDYDRELGNLRSIADKFEAEIKKIASKNKIKASIDVERTHYDDEGYDGYAVHVEPWALADDMTSALKIIDTARKNKNYDIEIQNWTCSSLTVFFQMEQELSADYHDL